MLHALHHVAMQKANPHLIIHHADVAEPYAHFSWAFRDVVGQNPTYTCTAANLSHAFDFYTGEDNFYVQQQNQNFFYV
jgi:hypothetical protein